MPSTKQMSVTEKPGEKTKPEETPGATLDPLSTPNNKQLLEAISCLGASLRNDMSELRAEHKTSSDLLATDRELSANHIKLDGTISQMKEQQNQLVSTATEHQKQLKSETS